MAASKPAPAKEKECQTLHEYEAYRETAQPKANAWGGANAARFLLSHPCFNKALVESLSRVLRFGCLVTTIIEKS